ncbi:ribosomal protein S24/S35 [Striga asiatica]|uniref:Ribosomal protein S24/S35 n=1 Tax=Striga asiatica TaxID=4170 RepID=A0A5A7P3M2_STRAF|nr:ribosomal protein S24/S35 [Striga asiatica]
MQKAESPAHKKYKLNRYLEDIVPNGNRSSQDIRLNAVTQIGLSEHPAKNLVPLLKKVESLIKFIVTIKKLELTNENRAAIIEDCTPGTTIIPLPKNMRLY